MPGVRRVVRASSHVSRLFWSAVCLAALSLFCLQMSEVLTRYFAYPKKVTVEVVPTPVLFPSISICNMRNLDLNILLQLNDMFLLDDNPYHHIESTNNSFIKDYMKTVAKFGPLYQKYHPVFPEIFQEVFSRSTFSANMNHDVIAEAAIKLEKFVVNCYFAGRRCNVSAEFHRFFDPTYFNCFTYEAPSNNEHGGISESPGNQQHGGLWESPSNQELSGLPQEGIENGFSTIVFSGSGLLKINLKKILMLPGLHEWRSMVSGSEGVRVVIHPARTRPLPLTEGFNVPPGFSASLGIHLRRNTRIGYPHGNCSHSSPFQNEAGRRYRLLECQQQCLQENVIKQCGCADNQLPVPPEVPLCKSDAIIPDMCMFYASTQCLTQLIRFYEKLQCVQFVRTNKQACGCFPPCHDVSYDVTYSLSKWPAAGYQGDAAFFEVFKIEQFKKRLYAGAGVNASRLDAYFLRGNRERVMADFARLNIYVADINVMSTEETAAYPPSRLAAELGGQLGLWVGLSVISLSEVLELALACARHLANACKTQQPEPV